MDSTASVWGLLRSFGSTAARAVSGKTRPRSGITVDSSSRAGVAWCISVLSRESGQKLSPAPVGVFAPALGDAENVAALCAPRFRPCVEREQSVREFVRRVGHDDCAGIVQTEAFGADRGGHHGDAILQGFDAFHFDAGAEAHRYDRNAAGLVHGA